eukprot:g2994.t1
MTTDVSSIIEDENTPPVGETHTNKSDTVTGLILNDEGQDDHDDDHHDGRNGDDDNNNNNSDRDGIDSEKGKEQELGGGGGLEDSESEHLQDGDVDDDENAERITLKPSEVVTELERFIVGQKDAKRAVAIALRNRLRRQRLPEDLRKEVTPKNILMVGPTGCGKTEIARRLATLAEAPFIKVEATKFTEVGFHGRDVDMIIRDLMESAMTLVKNRAKQQRAASLKDEVCEELLEALLDKEYTNGDEQKKAYWRELFFKGDLDEQHVEIMVTPKDDGTAAGAIFGAGSGASGAPGGIVDFRDITTHAVKLFSAGAGRDGKLGGPGVKRKMTIKEAKGTVEDQLVERYLDQRDLLKEAIYEVEQNGIVFIDEIDKICKVSDYKGDASDEGVQRDLLPLIEGSTVNTKHGNVRTDHILFIASGAFHHCRPADMLPELQGRLPIRVELAGLSEEDMYRILTEPEFNLVRQNVEMMKTENVVLDFEEDAVREIAKVASDINRNVENIGARRLHTVIEKIMDDYSFEAPEMEPGTTVNVTVDIVREKLGDMELLKKTDLKKFIL